MDEKQRVLSRVPLFARCGGRSLEAIGRLADEVDVKDGTELTREGSSGGEFFVIVDGKVRLERGGKEIAVLGPGDFLGEISLIDGGPRTATATADGPARLLVVAHREFHTLMADYPDIRLEILEALAQRVRSLEPEALV
ncbi:MAG TPA: cyclic nucleotide-binding domain-containing protein [Candidatus Limnocylindrales bacterium]|jgi:CRP-like cAMP-binding protein